jgi:radical SAM superfamily enzyme YgiQ (UPF0313 family)
MAMPNDGTLARFRAGRPLPLSVLCASSLVDKEGYKVKIIDQRIDKNWEKNLRAELAKKPLLIGISSMTGAQIGYGLQISKIAKEFDMPIVWGGVHPSLIPEQVLENNLVDMVVKGEGEITLLELANALEKGKKLDGIKGLWYKEGGKIKSNGDREFFDMNKLPQPPYHLVNVDDYFDYFFGHKLLSIQTSKGCPYQCAFCYNLDFNHRKWRALTVENALERIQYVVDKFKVKGVWLRDDNFFADFDRAKKILKGVEKMCISWGSSGARVDVMARMNADYFRLIENSGCKFLFMGYESGCDRILSLMNKGIITKQIIDTNKKLKDLNVIQRASFIIGYPTETIEETKQTVNFVFKVLRDNPHLIVTALLNATPYPGTDLFELAKQHGFHPPKSLEEWNDFKFEVSNIPWEDEKRKKQLRLLMFASYFLNKKVEEQTNNPLLKIVSKIYTPIAEYRLKNFKTGFPIELSIASLFGF